MKKLRHLSFFEQKETALSNSFSSVASSAAVVSLQNGRKGKVSSSYSLLPRWFIRFYYKACRINLTESQMLRSEKSLDPKLHFLQSPSLFL
ncbi:hypothetical protein CARUB_v10022244mg [Capsella rubella]|uniref:Uncharacterized protein n=1 Tax=Capsella rubella TaxID=81985 RepID=R0HXV6_9BRAS|nr:hypothetical protein CARUB_v10022244mg [Capsella rubella]